MNNFLPEGYKTPAGNYMKFQEGENRFRVLSSAIVGYEYWNEDNKAIRSKTNWNVLPRDIKVEEDGSVKINHFWAFAVWNYEDAKIQVLEVTQKTIMAVMNNYIKNPKYGSPQSYDLVVTREKVSGKTNYTTIADPPETVDPKIVEIYASQNINLEALFEGGDPFTSKETPAGLVSKAEAAKEMEEFNKI